MTVSNLFIPVQDSATRAFEELRGYYGRRDFHAHYIRAFMLTLSPMLKKNLLIEEPLFVAVDKLYPLPPEDASSQYLCAEGFLLYIMVFEQIMRQHHIIGGWEEESVQSASDGTTVDPMIDYLKKGN